MIQPATDGRGRDQSPLFVCQVTSVSLGSHSDDFSETTPYGTDSQSDGDPSPGNPCVASATITLPCTASLGSYTTEAAYTDPIGIYNSSDGNSTFTLQTTNSSLSVTAAKSPIVLSTCRAIGGMMLASGAHRTGGQRVQS